MTIEELYGIPQLSSKVANACFLAFLAFAVLFLFILPLPFPPKLKDAIHRLRWITLYVGPNQQRAGNIKRWLKTNRVKYTAYIIDDRLSGDLSLDGFTNHLNMGRSGITMGATALTCYRIDIRKRDRERVLSLLQTTGNTVTVEIDA